MPGAVLCTGPRDEGEAGFAFKELPLSQLFTHPHSSNQQKGGALSGILLWVVGRIEFFTSGFQKGGSCPHRKSIHKSGMQISQRQGRTECGGVGEPQESDLAGS